MFLWKESESRSWFALTFATLNSVSCGRFPFASVKLLDVFVPLDSMLSETYFSHDGGWDMVAGPHGVISADNLRVLDKPSRFYFEVSEIQFQSKMCLT